MRRVDGTIVISPALNRGVTGPEGRIEKDGESGERYRKNDRHEEREKVSV